MNTPDPETEALRHRVTQLQAEQATWQHTVAELRTTLRHETERAEFWTYVALILAAVCAALILALISR